MCRSRFLLRAAETGGASLSTSDVLKDASSKADYQSPINKWEQEQTQLGIVFCFVQYEGVGPDQRPRMYLATPKEVADQLRSQANGRGYGALLEHHVWTAQSQAGAGVVDKIPERWRFSAERVEQMIATVRNELVAASGHP